MTIFLSFVTIVNIALAIYHTLLRNDIHKLFIRVEKTSRKYQEDVDKFWEDFDTTFDPMYDEFLKEKERK